MPPGVLALRPYNEKADRRRVRRALSAQELDRLVDAARRGGHLIARRDGRGGRVLALITGYERAMLYRTAMGTGFRADELRTLTPERFHLEGDAPTITVVAKYSKHRRDDVQPIRRDLAADLKAFLAGKDPDAPWVAVPANCARMLRLDLAAAGIPERTEEGTVDFHALRHSYISAMIESGTDPKTVQELARHSTITLTIDRYSHSSEARKRRAIEGEPCKREQEDSMSKKSDEIMDRPEE